MKKKYYLIPIIAIASAVLAGLFITFFTTSLTYYICQPELELVPRTDGSETYEAKDCFYAAKKVGKIVQLAYKLNPCAENLDTLTLIYDPDNYILGKSKNNTPTSDFLKNSVKYTKMYYETEFAEEDGVYAIPYSMDYGVKLELLPKFSNGVEYAKALYLNGQVEESQKVIEELIKMFSPEYYGTSIGTLKDYLYLAFSSTENVTLKQWVLEKEKEIEKMIMNDSKIMQVIEKRGYLFSNPDYDTYVSHNWPEYVRLEDEADEETIEETVETPTP